ncbi:uncharacterized protein LOC141697403 isoform X2 [Apium graveolens]|uniref:uncharacterized protein LOC141697403 isoform X2 n=1 Tax=Apium graveolens TaxID=4045 RepID=UPI003D7A80AD
MVLCLRNNFPLSVAVFRKVFQFYNSSMSQPGWVLTRQRPKIPHIFDSNSIVENNPKWRDEFVRLTWAGGDWATLFRRPFCKVSDGSPGSIRLTDEEEVAYQALISDDGKTDTWTLLEEFSLKKVGLSQASDKACEAINNVNRPKEGESGRQKRAKLNRDPRSKPDAPAFLKPHVPVVELGDDVDPPLKAHSFRPNWGFRRSDTVVGSTKHAKDWSYHSITPHDFTDIVTGSDIETIELLGSQAQAASNTYFLAALHQARSWKGNSDEFEKEMKKWEERAKVLEKKLDTKKEELAKAHSELVKLRSDKEKLIDDYMDSDKFKNLMEIHDKGLYSLQFTQGWDAAVKAVSERHPGLVDPKDFISPEQAETEDSIDALFNSPQPDDRILDPNTASPPASPAKDAEGVDKEQGNEGSRMEE